MNPHLLETTICVCVHVCVWGRIKRGSMILYKQVVIFRIPSPLRIQSNLILKLVALLQIQE